MRRDEHDAEAAQHRKRKFSYFFVVVEQQTYIHTHTQVYFNFPQFFKYFSFLFYSYYYFFLIAQNNKFPIHMYTTNLNIFLFVVYLIKLIIIFCYFSGSILVNFFTSLYNNCSCIISISKTQMQLLATGERERESKQQQQQQEMCLQIRRR